MRFKLLVVCIALWIVSGCTTLSDVRKELDKGGFALWYPAEGGITAGQIWKISGKKKDIIQLKPDSLQTFGPYPAKFETLEQSVNADISLDVDFAEEILSDAGPISAKFREATVKSITLEFGDTEIERLPLGQLRDDSVVSKLPESYRNDLEKVRSTWSQHVLLAAVVSTSGMKYIFECKDTTKLKASAPEISKMLQADFDLKLVSKTRAVWEIPSSQELAIGVSPVSGIMLELSDEQIKQFFESLPLDRDINYFQFHIPSDLYNLKPLNLHDFPPLENTRDKRDVEEVP